jgi:hypothetical protein
MSRSLILKVLPLAPAVVTLTRPKNCGKGVTQFTRLAETFTHSRPTGTSRKLTISFPCSS